MVIISSTLSYIYKDYNIIKYTLMNNWTKKKQHLYHYSILGKQYRNIFNMLIWGNELIQQDWAGWVGKKITPYLPMSVRSVETTK